MTSETLKISAGAPTKQRISLLGLCKFAKESQIATIIVGQATKTGTIAGLQMLQHTVDAVFLMGINYDGTRNLKTTKNRYGEIREVSPLYMTADGLVQTPGLVTPEYKLNSVGRTEKEINEMVGDKSRLTKLLTRYSMGWIKRKAIREGIYTGSTTVTITAPQIKRFLQDEPNFVVSHVVGCLNKQI